MTYFQPASLSRREYIFPISPMPMMPILLPSSMLTVSCEEEERNVGVQRIVGCCEKEKKREKFMQDLQQKFARVSAADRTNLSPAHTKMTTKSSTSAAPHHREPDVPD
jgi:hypothetical protein